MLRKTKQNKHAIIKNHKNTFFFLFFLMPGNCEANNQPTNGTGYNSNHVQSTKKMAVLYKARRTGIALVYYNILKCTEKKKTRKKLDLYQSRAPEGRKENVQKETGTL